MRHLVWIALTATAIVALNEPAAAQQSRATFDAQVAAAIERGSSATVRVIVRVAAERRTALKLAWEQRGHRVKREHPAISALTIELAEHALEALTREEGVLSLSFDASVSGHSDNRVAPEVHSHPGAPALRLLRD
jgi:hypothetical protein